jgi:hypothetical protein
VIFIFITDIGSELGLAGSKLFYDGTETSQITSSYDGFIKSSRGLICDAQSMMLSENIIDAFLYNFLVICDKF